MLLRHYQYHRRFQSSKKFWVLFEYFILTLEPMGIKFQQNLKGEEKEEL
jgi:hypothetical protein